MPSGLAFNLAAWAIVAAHPGTALPLVAVQLAFTLGFVASFVSSFSERQRLITACIEP